MKETFQTFRAADVDDAPASAGVYAWYLKLRSKEAFSDYHEVFKSQSLEAEAKGNLLKKYAGQLTLESVDMEMVNDFGLLEAATAAFCPPLYIGITVDQTLRKRLRDHREALNDAIYGEVNDDSEFGERIAMVIKEGGNIGLNSFFARVISVPQPNNRKQIEEVEYYLNRTYVPIYGKK